MIENVTQSRTTKIVWECFERDLESFGFKMIINGIIYAMSKKCSRCGASYDGDEMCRDCMRIIANKYQRGRSIKKSLRNEVWNIYMNGKQDGYCWAGCGTIITKDAKWDCAHIVSFREGGQSVIENLRPACVTCNRSSQQTDLLTFRCTANANAINIKIENIYKDIFGNGNMDSKEMTNNLRDSLGIWRDKVGNAISRYIMSSNPVLVVVLLEINDLINDWNRGIEIELKRVDELFTKTESMIELTLYLKLLTFFKKAVAAEAASREQLKDLTARLDFRKGKIAEAVNKSNESKELTTEQKAANERVANTIQQTIAANPMKYSGALSTPSEIVDHLRTNIPNLQNTFNDISNVNLQQAKLIEELKNTISHQQTSIEGLAGVIGKREHKIKEQQKTIEELQKMGARETENMKKSIALHERQKSEFDDVKKLNLQYEKDIETVKAEAEQYKTALGCTRFVLKETFEDLQKKLINIRPLGFNQPAPQG
jgi:5-methylcytosine-specific restriction endonuclease McrA